MAGQLNRMIRCRALRSGRHSGCAWGCEKSSVGSSAKRAPGTPDSPAFGISGCPDAIGSRSRKQARSTVEPGRRDSVRMFASVTGRFSGRLSTCHASCVSTALSRLKARYVPFIGAPGVPEDARPLRVEQHDLADSALRQGKHGNRSCQPASCDSDACPMSAYTRFVVF